jgi:hypothetical protein
MGEILVITLKRGWERGTVGALNLAYFLQYDRFMGTGDEKGELLEILSLYHINVLSTLGLGCADSTSGREWSHRRQP